MRIVNPVAKIGENLACDYLAKKGYKILERNYRKSYAEIDIIALSPDREVLVFVEVKTRTSEKFGTPLESITYWKLKPLTRLAEFYSLNHPKLPQSLRIDAIAVYLTDKNLDKIAHVENVSGF